MASSSLARMERYQFAAINPGCRVYNSPAVVDIAGDGPPDGWHLFEACGGPPTFRQPGEVVNYRLSNQDFERAAWPMFRGSPEHSGVAFSTLPGREPSRSPDYQ